MLPLVSASIIITPNPVNVEMFIGSEVSIPILLNSSNNNISLFNLSFTSVPCVTFPTILSIQPNQVGYVNVNISTDAVSCSGNYVSTLRGMHYIQVDHSPEQKVVSIGNLSFNPNLIQVKKGDTVVFNNTLEYAVVLTSPEFTTTIEAHSSFGKTYDAIGDYAVQCSTLGFWLDIDVVNYSTMELAYNSQYDTQLGVNIQSFYNVTELRHSWFSGNITVKYGTTGEALLNLENKGAEMAKNVTITTESNWLSMNKNNFDINAGSSTFVLFTVDPKLLNASESNQSYNLHISIKSDNTVAQDLLLNVAIPYEKYLINDTPTYEDLLYKISDLKNLLALLQVPDCSEFQRNTNQYSIGVNYTWQDVYQMKSDLAMINQNLGTNGVRGEMGLLKQYSDQNQNDIRNLTESYSRMKSETEENAKRDGTRFTVVMFFVFIFLLLLISGIIIGFILYKRKNQKKGMLITRRE